MHQLMRDEYDYPLHIFIHSLLAYSLPELLSPPPPVTFFSLVFTVSFIAVVIVLIIAHCCFSNYCLSVDTVSLILTLLLHMDVI